MTHIIGTGILVIIVIIGIAIVLAALCLAITAVPVFFIENLVRLHFNWLAAAASTRNDLELVFYKNLLEAWRRWLFELAHNYVLKYNRESRLKEAYMELARRRDLFCERGGSLFSPKWPLLSDVLKDWGELPLLQYIGTPR